MSPSGLVRLSQSAAAHPGAATVLMLADRHFTAINDGDYSAWSGTVVPRRAESQPSGRWLEDYRSTYDSSVEIISISDAGPGAVTVVLSSMSTQDIVDAPPSLPVNTICWQTQWPVVSLAAGGGRIETPPRGTTTMEAC